MNSKRISSFLTLLFSVPLASCASAPKGVTTAEPSATQQSTAATAPSAPSSGIAVGHDSPSAPTTAGLGASSQAGPVKWTAPARWGSKPAREMRAATYLIPAAQGDGEGAECAVFLNIGGGVDANIKRWIGQFEQPDGSPSESKANQKKETINGLEVTTVDLIGTFKGGGPMMGQSSGPKTGYRLLGAIVQTDEGEVFFKLTGPAKTVTAAQGEFQSLLKSLKK